MTFVAIGFQHVIANMFIIPAAIFSGEMRWSVYFPNFFAVFLGNAIGGISVGLSYFLGTKSLGILPITRKF